MTGIKAAREAVVARKDEDRETFLRKRGFSKSETDKIIKTVLNEEGHPPASIFDVVLTIVSLAKMPRSEALSRPCARRRKSRPLERRRFAAAGGVKPGQW